MERKNVGCGDDSVWLTAMTFRANENMVGAAMDTRGNWWSATRVGVER